MQNVLLIGNLMPANKPVFAEAEAFLKSKGHYVVNPARDYTLSMNDEVYFTRRYVESLTAVTAVYFLPDYYLLPFSDVLVRVAKSLSLPILNVQHPVNAVIENDYTNF